LDPSQYHLR